MIVVSGSDRPMRRCKEIVYIPVKTPIPIAITAGRKFRLIVSALFNEYCWIAVLVAGVVEVEVHQSPKFRPVASPHISDAYGQSISHPGLDSSAFRFNPTLPDKLSSLRRICLVSVSGKFTF